MYRWFIRRQIRAAFAALSHGDGPELVSRMSPDVHHVFPGNGPLGGERRTREDVAMWFEGLFRLLPDLEFHIRTLAVDGWPWDTRIGVEWTNSSPLRDVSAHTNTGTHILRIRNGRIIAFHAYLNDVGALTDALDRLAAHGIEEAAAPPILTGATRE